jgi:lysophospholipase L1-like esterase
LTSLKSLAFAAACAAICLAPGTALAKSSRRADKTKPSYYLALGDSLAAGAQPNAAGNTVPTNKGYADDLYAAERKKIEHLKLEKLGCLGETTTSMLKGGTFCRYKGTQLADAVKFIKAHKVSLITLDIGANNVDGCAKDPGSQLLSCVGSGLTRIKADVPKIVKALRQAAGAKVRIAGMTYYDPFLAYYLDPAPQNSLAPVSVNLSQQLNGDLISAFNGQKLRIADVATAFGTYIPFTTTAPLAGHGTVPLAVAKICQLTWMCAAPPRGPNIHGTVSGYQVMARVFEQAL